MCACVCVCVCGGGGGGGRVLNSTSAILMDSTAPQNCHFFKWILFCFVSFVFVVSFHLLIGILRNKNITSANLDKISHFYLDT